MPDKTFTLSLALAAACATASAMPPALLPAIPVSQSERAAVDMEQVATLRAQGPTALAGLLAEYDRAPRPELAEMIASSTPRCSRRRSPIDGWAFCRAPM